MIASVQATMLKSVVDKSRYTQDEILQYVQLSPDEDYCIPSTTKCFPEQYVRCQLSFEDPQMDKFYRETNEAMFEVYDYLTLKLEAMFTGKAHSFPQLFTKEWENHYSSFCPENELRERKKNSGDITEGEDEQFQAKTPDDRACRKDKKMESEDKRARKRMLRIDKFEKPKKMKFGRE